MSYTTPSRFWPLAGSLLLGLIFAVGTGSAHAAKSSQPQATLSAQASSEVAQDTVEIALAAQVSGASQVEVGRVLNTRLAAAMKKAQGHAGIEARSGSYRIWPTNDRDGHISEWRGDGQIVLRSTDFAAASQLAADLEPDVTIAGLSFSVSEARRVNEEQALLKQAVAAFQARAAGLAQALGFGGYRLRTIELADSGMAPPSPVRRMMSMTADAAVAAPVEGGHERVSVSLHGTIVLLPTQKVADQ